TGRDRSVRRSAVRRLVAGEPAGQSGRRCGSCRRFRNHRRRRSQRRWSQPALATARLRVRGRRTWPGAPRPWDLGGAARQLYRSAPLRRGTALGLARVVLLGNGRQALLELGVSSERLVGVSVVEVKLLVG